jgi:predicted NBD/HSP70 family sugar kinase
MAGGTNLPRVGGFNRTVILDAIRSHPEGLSRVELAERTGLTPQTVSNIVRRLLRDELVTESGRAPSTGGKPRTRLTLNALAYYAVGVHLDPDVTSCVVVDLRGQVVRRSHRQRASVDEPERAVRALATQIRRLTAKAQVPDDRVLGVGVASPGPIDRERGVVVEPPNLPRWHRVPLVGALGEATGLPVLLDNDATAAVIGERWVSGSSGTSDCAYLYFGTGIGCGLVLGDEVYRGTMGNAGEFGHLSIDARGPQCFCGNRGCLEASVSPHALVSEAHRLSGGRRTSLRLTGDPAKVTADHDQLCQEAEAGDRLANAVLDRAAERVALAATSLVNLLDVERIVLGGRGLRYSGERFRHAIDTAVNDRTIARHVRHTKVELSVIGEDAGAIGAASLVLDGAYSPAVSNLFARPEEKMRHA